ncbi:MAG: M48 family metalloprotease [Deltaproteobacteria bacterium]|nr:M48 family metalloprotease [Deltaproteobacteria bacterium]
MYKGKCFLLCLGAICALFVAISGCETMGTVSGIGTSIGLSMGVISSSQADSIKKGARAVSKSFQDITPEQEYYIGRSVGAIIVNRYKPYTNQKANMYINQLGQTLAQASDLPETFGGYHFLILDSDEINAFAAPGGLIFVTTGMIRCSKNEEAIAATLAHEIAHVQFRHGLQAIKKSRITEALTIIAIEGVKTYGGKDLAKLTKTFEGSISDITKTMIDKGYSRSFERQADIASTTILKRVGYDPNALVDMLKVMGKRLKPAGLDFARTHPSPSSRIADIQKTISAYTEVKTTSARHARFTEALGGI